jgi:adenylate cyclase
MVAARGESFEAMMKNLLPVVFALALGTATSLYTYLMPVKNVESSPLLDFEHKLLDLKFRWRGRIDVQPQVVIAAGDEKTVRSFGRWGTWDRENYAKIIENLLAAGADVVGFDMVFADPAGIDHTATARIGTLLKDANLAETAASLTVAASEGRAPAPDALAAVALAARNVEQEFFSATDGDEKLAAALEKYSSNVVQGSVAKLAADDGEKYDDATYAPILEKIDFILLREYGYGWKVRDQAQKDNGSEGVVASLDVHPGGKPSDLPSLTVRGTLVLPQAEFLGVAENLGFFSVDVDGDGVMRRTPLVFRVGEALLPSLSLSTAALRFGSNPLLLADPFYRNIYSKVGLTPEGGAVVEIPLDPQGRLLINYYGPSEANDPALPPESRGVFSRVSLADVFCADLPPRGQQIPEGESSRASMCNERALDLAGLRKMVEKKIVLVAVTAIGTYDQRVTPFSPMVPGVEVHAAAVQNMIDGRALQRPVLHVQIEIVIALALALLLGLSLPRVPVAAGVGLLVAVIGGWWFVDWNILFARDRWFHDVPLLLQVSLTWAGITAWGYLTTGREKARLKAEFSTVLAPTVVDQLLVNPDLAGLGGAERELTVMFSDIRGFTTMSEKLSPEGLTQFLNEYLTPMTDILIQHEGTLDKYMGDAIMAFWGAPIEQKDHAKRACLTAVDMLEKLEELKAKWRAEGKPEIDIGIGLNSGLMRVGFMGSARMRNYTLLGDNVNLGSRLEGTNKNYGTHIIVSETTYKAAADVVHGRWLDAVRVKGKKEPVNIYEVIGKGPVPAGVAAFAAPFEEGLNLYRAQKWDEAEAKFKAAVAARGGSDPPSEVYLERIEHFRHEPPPNDWDGVYEFKTK